MKPIKALFVDDEKLQHKMIRSLLDELRLPVDAHFFFGAKDLFFSLEDHPDVDVIFLDVEMPGLDGLAIARKIRQNLPDVAIVFITAYSDYAVKSYDVKALDYLLKPVTAERLRQALHRVAEVLPAADTYLLIDRQKYLLHEIRYIEAQGHLCLLHRKNEVVELRTTIRHVSDRLSDDFIQTHRAYLVNLNHMFQVNKDHVVLDDKTVLPLSRRQSKPVLEAFVAHFTNRGYSL